MSQSINSTDFLPKKLGLRPKLIIKLLIRFLKYGSNYCTSTQPYFIMQVYHVHLGVQVDPDFQSAEVDRNS